MSSMSNEFPTNVFVSPYPTQPLTDLPPAPVATPVAAETGDVVDSMEAAQLLGVTPNNLRQIVHKKQLSPVGKRGRRTLFTRSSVEALAASRSNG